MKSISNEEFNWALSLADESTRVLMNSDCLYVCLEENLRIRNLRNSIPVSSLLVSFGDYLLKLRSKDELVNILAESGVDDGLNFISGVEEALNKREISRDPEYENIDAEKVQNGESNSVDLQSELEEAEQILGKLNTVRTMRSDAEEPVYTSTQSAILNESRYTPAPTYPTHPAPSTGKPTNQYQQHQTESGPRWDTDR